MTLERYVHVPARSTRAPGRGVATAVFIGVLLRLHAGARTWRGDGGIHRRAPAAPHGRPDVPDVEPHRVLHGRLPEGSASGSRRPADSSDRCRRLPPPATPTVPFAIEIGPLPARDRSRGTRGARCRVSIGPGTLKDPTLKDSKDPQGADLEPPFPPDARPRPLTYDHASQRTTARTGHLTPPWNQPFGPVGHDARRAVATGSKQAEQGRARGAGLSLPARGPAASRGSPGSLLSGGARPPSPERIAGAPCDPVASRPGQSQGIVP